MKLCQETYDGTNKWLGLFYNNSMEYSPSGANSQSADQETAYFYESKSPLPCSQQPTTDQCPKSDENIPRNHILCLYDRF
jgi:hypothetical protein